MNGQLRRIPGTDISVHPIGVDGSVFGWASGVEETARMLDTMVGYGGNLVSTADHYAGGRSEIMIGGWLATLADRGQAVISTKVGRHPDSPGLSTRNVVRSVEASLRRLDTGYIDLLTLDGVDEETPIDETLEAVDMLRRAGKVRYLAVSNYPGARVQDINALAETAVYPPVRLISAVYNLMQRDQFENDLAPVASALGIGVLARLPLASGFLSGDFRSKEDQPTSPLFDDALSHVGRVGNRVLGAIDEVGASLDESNGRIALSWALTKPGVVAAAVRVRSSEQLAELSGSDGIVLSRQQVATLDNA